MESTVVRPQFITSVTVNPGQTLVVITVDAVLVLQPDGNWTRTPLKSPCNLAKAKRDVTAGGPVPVAVSCWPWPRPSQAYRWHRKGGEDCDAHRN
jgi:hypothetical protein